MAKDTINLTVGQLFVSGFISEHVGGFDTVGHSDGTLWWRHESCKNDDGLAVRMDTRNNTVWVNFNLPHLLYWAINGHAASHDMIVDEFGSFEQLEGDA